MLASGLLVFTVMIIIHVYPMALCRIYQDLNGKIPYLSLANLPTPINKCCVLEKSLDFESIYIKQDDLTAYAGLYGGNKVRKLEFLLADALNKGATEIMTMGSAGTNHGLATACYANKLGLPCVLMLKPQPNSSVVRQNLLLDHYYNARVELFADVQERKQALDNYLKENKKSYFISTGGSVPLGVLGFVNAAFELKAQIQAGVMPEPDFIYVPVGTGGTTAGLLLGIVLAQLKSIVIAVAVEPEEKENELQEKIKTLFFDTNKLLALYSVEIPLVKFPNNKLIINKKFCSAGYGVWSEAENNAIALIKDNEGIALEGTYSAKAAAALIDDVKNNILKKNEVILWWNTYCGLDFSHLTNSINYKELNSNLHLYFENQEQQ